jgi:hypothetical protein
VIREEEVSLPVLVGCKNMADYQKYEKGDGMDLVLGQQKI